MSIEAMKQALEALEEIHVGNMTPMAETNWNKAITSLRQAIAEAENEQCKHTGTWTRASSDGKTLEVICCECGKSSPPQRPAAVGEDIRKPLTDDEIDLKCLSITGFLTRRERDRHVWKMAAAHGIKEKNT